MSTENERGGQPAMNDPDRHPVEALAEEFLERHRRGERPTIDDYAAAHPEIADDIRDLFPTILSIEQLKTDGSGSSGRHASLGGVQLERLGDFRILGEIGRGGMGIVYEAEQESLGRHVAVKVLPRQTLLDSRQLARFHREARTAAKLHHTNIVPVFGTGEQDGFHYYVMQFIGGLGLDVVLRALNDPHTRAAMAPRTRSELVPSQVADALRRGSFAPTSVGPPSSWSASSSSASSSASVALDEGLAIAGQSGPAQAVAVAPADAPAIAPADAQYWRSVARIGLQVAGALQYAHAQGTLHRDIKPGNLLLDEQGVIWVADFGLARAMEQDGVTQSGDIVGTLQYIAPEQLHGSFDGRSDLYGLALTMYELLTLRPAFASRDRSQLIQKIDQGQVERPRRINPAIPADLETIVLKAMSRDPGHRYQTAREMGNDLQRFLEDRPILARRVSSVEQVWRWCRRNKAMAGLAASTILAVVIAAVSGWVGYVTARAETARAERNLTLAQAEKSRAESNLALAQAETARAESNLALWLQMADDIFDKVSGPDMFQTIVEDPETGESEALTLTPMSESDAALLQSMMQYYDRFAAQNAGNQELLRETARAHRRVGDSQRRLGQYDDAEDAYRQALQMYERLAEQQDNTPRQTEVAILHNELGRTLAMSGRRPDAILAHQAALQLLEQPNAPVPTVKDRFELARTHNLLGSAMTYRSFPGRGGRGGRRPPEDRENRAPPRATARGAADAAPADAVASGGTEAAPDGPSDGERRGRGGSGRRGRGARPDSPARKHQETALEIIDGLLAADRQNADFRLAKARICRDLARSSFGSPQRQEYTDQAIGLFTALCADHPDADYYAYELAATLYELSRRGSGRSPDASDRNDVVIARLQKAKELSERLCDDNPTIPEYRDVLGTTSSQLAQFRRAEDPPEQAERHLSEALDIQIDLLERFPTDRVYRTNLESTLGTILQVLRDEPVSAATEPAAPRSLLDEAIDRLAAAKARSAKLRDKNPALPEHGAEVAYWAYWLARIELESERHREAAEQHLREALPIQIDLVDRFPADRGHRSAVLRTIGLLDARERRRRAPAEREALRSLLDQAITRLEEARARSAKLRDENPDVQEHRDVLAFWALLLAQLERGRDGDHGAAEQHVCEALEMYLDLAERAPADRSRSFGLVQALGLLDACLSDERQREPPELTAARILLERAIAYFESDETAASEDRRLRFGVTRSYSALARVLEALGETELSKQAADKAGRR